jgi:tetratricopeptide (TPR) repeat protein
MKRIVRHIAVIMIVSIQGLKAQESYTNRAIIAYQNNDYSKAMTFIDSALVTSKEKDDAYTWYVRGMIYKDHFKQYETTISESNSRIKAIESFKTCIEKDTKNEHSSNSKVNIKWIAGSFYNEMIKNLDTVNYEKAEPLYEKYKQTMRIVDPNMDFNKNDKEVYLFLGAQISRKFNFKREAGTQKYFDMAIGVFNKVISLDSNDCDAHFQIAQLYYNYGVESILSLEDTTPLDKVIAAQDKCVQLFQKSLPHMKKAYQLAKCKSKKELVRALMGIYYQLNEMDKYNDLNTQLQLIKE